MTAPHLVEELLEDDELDEQPRTVHVYPVFGRRHVLEGPCWCEPWLYEDGVVVHNQEHWLWRGAMRHGRRQRKLGGGMLSNRR